LLDIVWFAKALILCVIGLRIHRLRDRCYGEVDGQKKDLSAAQESRM
jgi:hypothetical protein